jgi:hypothetical protein
MFRAENQRERRKRDAVYGRCITHRTLPDPELPDGSAWITLVQIVEDPEYLMQLFIVNYHFKKLPDGSKWNPTPCSVK